MDQKAVNKLEREIEKAIAGVIIRLGLKKLPLLPPHRRMLMMAKAAVAVYEAEVDCEEDRPLKEGEPYPLVSQQPFLCSFRHKSAAQWRRYCYLLGTSLASSQARSVISRNSSISRSMRTESG